MDPPDGRIAQRTPFSSIAAELPVRLMCKQLPNACHYLARCKNLILILQSVSQIPFNASTFHVLQSSVVHTLADLLTQDCQLAIGHGQPLPYFPTVCHVMSAPRRLFTHTEGVICDTSRPITTPRMHAHECSSHFLMYMFWDCWRITGVAYMKCTAVQQHAMSAKPIHITYC